MQSTFRLVIGAVVATLALPPAQGLAQNWPSFRGASAAGVGSGRPRQAGGRRLPADVLLSGDVPAYRRR